MLPFEYVREKLLRAGMTPRHAKRCVEELQDHLSDLIAQQRAAGADARQAEARARELLGSDEQLARAMMEGAPRSMAARAPAVVFALLPMALMAVLIFVTGVVAYKLLWPVRGMAPSDLPAGYAYFVAAVGVFTGYVLGPLLAAGCIVTALRQRLTSWWIWAGLVLIALFSGPVGFHTHVVDDGGTLYSMVRIAYQHGQPDLTATMTLAVSHSVVMFLALGACYRRLQKRYADAPQLSGERKMSRKDRTRVR